MLSIFAIRSQEADNECCVLVGNVTNHKQVENLIAPFVNSNSTHLWGWVQVRGAVFSSEVCLQLAQ